MSFVPPSLVPPSLQKSPGGVAPLAAPPPQDPHDGKGAAIASTAPMAPDSMMRSEREGANDIHFTSNASVAVARAGSAVADATPKVLQQAGEIAAKASGTALRAASGPLAAGALVLGTTGPAGETDGDLAKTRAIDASRVKALESTYGPHSAPMAGSAPRGPSLTTTPAQHVDLGPNHTAHPQTETHDVRNAFTTTPIQAHGGSATITPAGRSALDKPAGTAIHSPATAADHAMVARSAQEVRASVQPSSIETVTWSKVDPKTTAAIERDFNSNKKPTYLKHLVKEHEPELRAAGINDQGIADMRKGNVPDGYSVHHVRPKNLGGDNDFSNLVLMRNEEHRMLTGLQNSATSGMRPGESRTFDFVMTPKDDAHHSSEGRAERSGGQVIMSTNNNWKSLLDDVTETMARRRRPPADTLQIEDAKTRARAANLHLPEEVLDFYRYTNGFDINGTHIVPLTSRDDDSTLFDIQTDLSQHGETAYGMANDDVLLYEPEVRRYRRAEGDDVLKEYASFSDLLEDVLWQQLELLRTLASKA